jgi:hypothetical protein
MASPQGITQVPRERLRDLSRLLDTLVSSH